MYVFYFYHLSVAAKFRFGSFGILHTDLCRDSFHPHYDGRYVQLLHPVPRATRLTIVF